MVRPFAVPGGLMWDPFAGSGALLRAASEAGMDAVGCEIDPSENHLTNLACIKDEQLSFSEP